MLSRFSDELFAFFEELSQNNNRDWFAQNKVRYEECVLTPALSFVESMQKPLNKISPCFVAVPKRMGGSLMRIYRDIRFSKEKTPYKTNLGIQFRHQAGKDVHAPGFYVHVDPKEIFFGAGVWRPDNDSLRQIRTQIDDDPVRWKQVTGNRSFRAHYAMHGDSLVRPPTGYAAEHPFLEDLKRKDHVVLATLSRKDILSENLTSIVSGHMKATMPYIRFLCDALQLPS